MKKKEPLSPKEEIFAASLSRPANRARRLRGLAIPSIRSERQ